MQPTSGHEPGDGHGAARAGRSDAGGSGKSEVAGAAARTTGGVAEARNGSSQGGIIGFVNEHPTLVLATAVTFGLGMALALQPRRRERFDKRAMRAGRDFERRLTRELRNLRSSETAERVAGGIGSVLSSVDFSSLMQQGQSYLEALRRRVS